MREGMNRIRHGTGIRITSVIAALVMLLLVIPSALATPTDWVRLNLEVVWTREDGTSECYEASPVYEMPYSFWVRVPEEALGSLKLRVSHSSHNYFYIPESGSPLTDVVPVDVSPDGKTYTMIQAVEGEHIPVIYTIELSTQAVARAVAEETGAAIRELHSMQTVTQDQFDAGETWVSLMEKNVGAIREGLN